MATRQRCSECDKCEADGHNYRRTCGYFFQKGLEKNVRLAVAHQTGDKLCGCCGKSRHTGSCEDKLDARMTKTSLTPEQQQELERLTEAHSIAMHKTSAAAAAHGMASEEYRKADAVAGELWLQLRTLQGKNGKDWMA